MVKNAYLSKMQQPMQCRLESPRLATCGNCHLHLQPRPCRVQLPHPEALSASVIQERLPGLTHPARYGRGSTNMTKTTHLEAFRQCGT